jgi:NAD(P)-dependent dehydrogenase (short-subunit alcohol dehydrogenase family)
MQRKPDECPTGYPEFAEGIALVAGGSGGLGAGVCRALAAAGSNVALTYRSRRENAERVADEIRQQGRQAQIASIDLEDFDALKTWVDELAAGYGRIHSVVYAAGPPIEFQYIHEIAPTEWARVIRADVNGCFNLVAATLPQLRAQGGGALVSIITCALSHVPPHDILSAAPKAAIQSLMRGVALEEGPHGIRANCAAPGLFAAGLGLSTINEQTQRYAEKMTQAIPLRRRGSPGDMGDAVRFLLSGQARYVSGETVAVAGGLQLV